MACLSLNTFCVKNDFPKNAAFSNEEIHQILNFHSRQFLANFFPFFCNLFCSC
jgi:hypothetical protein